MNKSPSQRQTKEQRSVGPSLSPFNAYVSSSHYRGLRSKSANLCGREMKTIPQDVDPSGFGCSSTRLNPEI